jgi:MFS family permease
LSLTVNTALIVLAQLFVLRRVRRARRSSALAISGLILAASWAVFGLAALPVAATGRVAFVFGFTALFGLGETVLAPTVSPLVNRLTDDRLRGRANSLAALSQSLAFIICPALATGFIAAGAAAIWIGLLCAGCLATVAVGARLRRALTSDQDHVTEAPATRPEPVAGRRRAARSGTRG